MMTEHNIEETYPQVVSEVMEYIIDRKKRDEGAALLDLIHDYCIRSGNSLELVGDAIASDVYFKSFIEKDCEVHNIIRTQNPEKKPLGKW
jgi:hypothetical protein